jgi:hypothetical protein
VKRLSLFVAALPVGAFAVTIPMAPAVADPVSCSADVCIVSISEYAPPVSAGAVALARPSGTAYVGSSAWLADVATAFQNGTASVTTAGASATSSQVVSGPGDVWLIIGQEVGVKPDGSKVYASIYRPGNWASQDFADVLVTTAPGGTSASGSALHWDVTNDGTTTYGVTVAPDRKSVKLKTLAISSVLPDYLQGGIDVESTPDGTTAQTTPQVLP